MQTFTNTNKNAYAIGRQTDVAIGDGENATSGNYWLSLSQWEPVNVPSQVRVPDAKGNRSSHSFTMLGERDVTISFAGTIEVDKIGILLYYATGEVETTQDGSLDAYKHVFTMRNNVKLPQFTVFYNIDSEDDGNRAGGYKKAIGCIVSELTIEIGESEATFSGTIMAKEEVEAVNLDSTISSLTVTALEYQANGLMRATFSGSPTLSAVKNGDVLNLTHSSISTINQGSFIVVNANNTAKTVDYINPKVTSASTDQTALSASANTISIVKTPVYSNPARFLLRRHSYVRNASAISGLSTATKYGMRNCSITINNNAIAIHESVQSPYASEILAKNIECEASFTQLSGKVQSGTWAVQYRDNNGTRRAWEFGLEDTSSPLDTGSTYNPSLQVQIDKAIGLGERGQGMDDERTIDWTLYTDNQQGIVITLQNTIDAYPIV